MARTTCDDDPGFLFEYHYCLFELSKDLTGRGDGRNPCR